MSRPASHSVLILDMFHYQDPEHEYTIDGFPTLALATEFARRWVRDSLEECRQPGQTAEETGRAWFAFGEDAVVLGGDYAGSRELDFFIEHPAKPAERDWAAIKRKAGIR